MGVDIAWMMLPWIGVLVQVRAVEPRQAILRPEPQVAGRILHDLLPSSELLMFDSEIALFQAIPSLVQRVGAFLTGND